MSEQGAYLIRDKLSHQSRIHASAFNKLSLRKILKPLSKCVAVVRKFFQNCREAMFEIFPNPKAFTSEI
jgi:hypothetical protein